MPSKREILALLTRDELVAIVGQYEPEPRNRRSKEALVEAIAGSPKTTLPGFIPELPCDPRKTFCQELGLDDSGRDKAFLVDRLVSAKVTRADSAPPPSEKNGGKSEPVTSSCEAIAGSLESLSGTGLESLAVG